MLRGQAMLFVGDSTVRDVFQSFVMLLKGKFGRQHFGKDVTATACDDSVRLNYVRNDLLLYSSDRADQQMVYGCSANVITQCYVRRAADANIVVLGVGQHFAPSFAHVRKRTGQPSPPGHSASHFFVNSFNHTVGRLVASRADASRGVIVLGASMPVPGCSRFTAPIGLDSALAAYAHPAAGRTYAPQWEENHQLNQAARWLAEAHGVAFIDVASPSMRRPDAARGLADTLSGSGVEDCVHFCPPGPYDTWSTLVYNLLRAERDRGANGGGSSGGGGAWGAHRPALFSINRSKWESVYGVASENIRAPSLATPLRQQPWWPFGCGGSDTVGLCTPKCTRENKAAAARADGTNAVAAPTASTGQLSWASARATHSGAGETVTEA